MNRRLKSLRKIIIFGSIILVIAAIWLRSSLQRRHHFDSAEHSYHTAVRSDLRNLASAQEVAYSERGSYAKDLAALDFVPSSEIHLRVFTNPPGWSAEARHRASSPSFRCMIFGGLLNNADFDWDSVGLMWWDRTTHRVVRTPQPPGVPACTEW